MATIRLVPPVYFLLSLIAMAALHRFLPLVTVLRPPITGLAAVPILAGMVFGPGAILAFRRQGTSVHPFHQPTALVTTGPYRYSRNPMYLALALVLVAVATWLGTLSPGVVVPLFLLAIQQRFILNEERRLTAAFGTAYLEYRHRVRRWL